MMLESIEKLRGLASEISKGDIDAHLKSGPLGDGVSIDWLAVWHRKFDELINSIQAEVDECYMKMPVDADGVPIHIGDKLSSDELPGREFTCLGFSVTQLNGVPWWTVEWRYDGESGTSEYVSAKSCRHAKPDSLKELLDDVSEGIICYPRERVTGYLEDNHSIGEAVMLDVRDRLRDLLGGDA